MHRLNGDYPVEVRIRIMAGQVYAASELGMWCFSPSGQLYYSTCPNEQGILALLQLNGCLDYMLDNKKGWDKPLILSDSLGMVFIAESILSPKDNGISMHILVGPFFMNTTSVKGIENALRQKISSIQAQRAFLRVLQKVPVLHISALDIYASMLHFTIYDEPIHNSDYYYQIEEKEKVGQIELEDEEKLSDDKSETDRSVDIEKRILQAIREGNPQIMELMKSAVSSAQGLVSESGNQIRDARNTLLVFNALSSRAAIDGGVPLQTVRTMERQVYEEIEKCRSISELHHLSNRMIDSYIKKVQETKESEQISKSIRETCDYIRANVQKELSVDDLADRIGYTPYYFSKKFNKEMGVRVTDFIKTARIDYAKMLLVSTNKSIQDISDALHFGTRNYFSKVFREVTGVTPASYREKGSM
ncbi:MAG: helix-turn-helix transcriptional regulator [Eubacteriales bacterium]|nr:helix-turn-helix transcriptional regulator [Eubacteriales bacterium]